MKKTALKIVLVSSSIIGFIGFLLSMIFIFIENNNSALIKIDGADGPTSIFLAEKTGSNSLLYLLTAVACIIAIGSWVLYKSNRVS